MACCEIYAHRDTTYDDPSSIVYTAALILAVNVTFLKQPLRLRRREAIPVATVGIFLICGFNVLTSFGQVLIESSKAAIIAYTMPSLTALLALIYLGERIGMRLVLALTIAMIGLGILASENLLSLIEQPIGPAIMMLAALSWAVGTVGLKSRTWRLPPLPLTVWFFAFSSLVVWPLVLLLELPWEQDWPSAPVLATLAFHILGPAFYVMFFGRCWWHGFQQRSLLFLRSQHPSQAYCHQSCS